MKRPAHALQSRRPETQQFRTAILTLRKEEGVSQETLARRLGISNRTLSNWENGFWLPPFRQRLHIVLALRESNPLHVLAIADGLGVSVNPGAAPLLKPFHDALQGDGEVTAPAAPRVPPTPEALRATVDAIVRDAADAMNVAANDLRAALGRTLAACAEAGATLGETQEAVAVRRPKAKGA